MTRGQRLDGIGPPVVMRSWPVPWKVVFALALFLASSTLIAEESQWRIAGLRPSVPDSPHLWHFWRAQASRSCGRHDVIALIGGSRLQAGVSPVELQRKAPAYRIVQLSVYGGGSPIGVLEELANDAEFQGLVICDVVEPYLIRTRWHDQSEYYTSRVHLLGSIEAGVRAFISDHFALMRSEVAIDNLIAHSVGALLRDQLRRAAFFRMRYDRAVQLDFSTISDIDSYRRRKTADAVEQYQALEFPTADAMHADFLAIQDMVAKVQSRGGDVVFIRMPSSGERYAFEHSFHPRSAYWDTFVSLTTATCIHFRDIPGMRLLTCPDDSHLDAHDARVFTDALVDELLRQDILHLTGSPLAN